MKTSEQTIVELQQKGYKRTKNREAILNIIYSAAKPISAGDILEKLAKQGLEPNKTTVYRKLDLLKQEGLIREVMIDSTTAYYERTDMHHHHHVICLNCKKISDFHPNEELEDSIEKTEQLLLKEKGFKTVQHSFEFFGYCAGCVFNV
ncbi:MAG TPA: transcriptional repressor [Candidatus Woesebacteria bacterium]|nr:transcriptional repressor [Candidatus Woesebacteria bacterium]